MIDKIKGLAKINEECKDTSVISSITTYFENKGSPISFIVTINVFAILY